MLAVRCWKMYVRASRTWYSMRGVVFSLSSLVYFDDPPTSNLLVDDLSIPFLIPYSSCTPFCDLRSRSLSPLPLVLVLSHLLQSHAAHAHIHLLLSFLVILFFVHCRQGQHHYYLHPHGEEDGVDMESVLGLGFLLGWVGLGLVVWWHDSPTAPSGPLHARDRMASSLVTIRQYTLISC